MAEKALYILAGYDDRTEEILSGLRNKLYDQGFSGLQTRDIPMHFTMGSYAVEHEEELKNRLEKIAETHRTFDTAFNHVGLFRPVIIACEYIQRLVCHAVILDSFF